MSARDSPEDQFPEPLTNNEGSSNAISNNASSAGPVNRLSEAGDQVIDSHLNSTLFNGDGANVSTISGSDNQRTMVNDSN